MSNMNKQIHWFSLTLSSLFLTLTMVVAGLLLTSNQVAAQNYIINPATDGGFEGSHGWTILNTNNVNKWIVGASEKSAGTKGAYISDNNNTNTLTNPQVGNSRIYLYKDVVIPLNATSISISFKYIPKIFPYINDIKSKKVKKESFLIFSLIFRFNITILSM